MDETYKVAEKRRTCGLCGGEVEWYLWTRGIGVCSKCITETKVLSGKSIASVLKACGFMRGGRRR